MEDRIKLKRVTVFYGNRGGDALGQTFAESEGVRLSCWWPEEGNGSRLLVRVLNEGTGAFVMHEWPAHAVQRVERVHA